MMFEYHIKSSIDLDEILEYLEKKSEKKEGKLNYYEGKNHKEIVKELPLKDLKKEILETYYDDKWPSAKFGDFEINLDENLIIINSDKELDLSKFDAEIK